MREPLYLKLSLLEIDREDMHRDHRSIMPSNYFYIVSFNPKSRMLKRSMDLI